MAKTQFDIKTGNTQTSDDDTTTQIQIYVSKWWFIIPALIVIYWVMGKL